MSKLLWFLPLCLFLMGCGAEETLETVADEWIVPVMAQPREIAVQLPEDALAPVLEQEGRKLYMAQECEILLETFPSGDLNATILALSGYEKDQLTVVETAQDGEKRFDFVWSTAGEQGDLLGRGAILDDGNYHYCMSLLWDPERPDRIGKNLFASFSLT